MVDQALENALRKRDELATKVNAALQQVEEWKRELSHTDAFIAAWHQFAGTEADLPTGTVFPIRDDIPLPQKNTKRPARNNSKKEEVAAEVRRIIAAEGRPVPRAELYNVLVERGFTIEGTDPDMVLSTMLWRAGEAAGVTRLQKGGYWLTEKEWPDAGYFPEEQEASQQQTDTEAAFDDLSGHGEKPQGVFK